MANQLGDILFEIETVQYKTGGGYSLFVACEIAKSDYEFTSSTPCMMLWITREQSTNDDYNRFLEVQDNLCEISTVSMAQEVVSAARQDKHDCTQDDLVRALVYYMINDAFYPFDEEC